MSTQRCPLPRLVRLRPGRLPQGGRAWRAAPGRDSRLRTLTSTHQTLNSRRWPAPGTARSPPPTPRGSPLVLRTAPLGRPQTLARVSGARLLSGDTPGAPNCSSEVSPTPPHPHPSRVSCAPCSLTFLSSPHAKDPPKSGIIFSSGWTFLLPMPRAQDLSRCGVP